MANLYDPVVWADGYENGDAARLTAAAGPNRWEAGIEALDNALDALADQVTALTDAITAVAATRAPSGPSSGRGTPAKGALFWDETLDKLLVGNGVAWENADGTALSGDGGTTTAAPSNFAIAVVAGGTIGQFNMSLTAPATVPGKTLDHYELRESQSPTGVAGATNLTTTTFSRTPGTAREYDYWVVAVYTDGTVSADSNHVKATLPFGGGGGSTNPYTILGLGPQGGGYWNLGIGYSTGHVDRAWSDLAAGTTWTPYYIPNSGGTGVIFRINMNGKTTSSNTKYTRCELREKNSNGTTNAAWSMTSGTHVLQYKFKLTHVQPLKPWVTIGQIHDSSSDLLSIKVKGDNTGALSVVATIDDVDHATKLATSYTLGTELTIRIETSTANGGTLKLYANGVLKITVTGLGRTGCYFKLGVYPQSKDNAGGFESPSEYCQAEIIGPVTVTHTPVI